jgi:hypothetical protein
VNIERLTFNRRSKLKSQTKEKKAKKWYPYQKNINTKEEELGIVKTKM